MIKKAHFRGTKNSWEQFYKTNLKTGIKDMHDLYKEWYMEDTVKQVLSQWKAKKDDVYLEIGCGTCFLGLELAKRRKVKVIGIDFSKTALESAKKLFKDNNITNAKFILGDITKMPIPNNSVDFIYGGGVIEHLKDTQQVVDELYRVLKPGGISYNTVPYLNLSALTYRQMWGNIPNLPIIKPLFEFLHINILGGNHLRFGYELSFTPRSLRKYHQNAGFKKIVVDKFYAKLMLEYIKWIPLRRFVNYINSKTFLIWPMLYVAAKK